jgi:hypothetical protein
MLTDRGILFCAERPPAFGAGRGISTSFIDFLVQKWSVPNMKSRATVTTADSSSDPRQPRRFEKKKNMFCRGPLS